MPRDTTVIAFRQPEAINDPLTEDAKAPAECWQHGLTRPRAAAVQS